jgi:magnesium transporter
MLFYCELIGKRVISDDHRKVGVLRDLLFHNGDTPRITDVVVDHNASIKIIPVSSLRAVNNHVEIKKNDSGKDKPGLSVSKVLLDKQIIDVGGNKVVRVNDVVLQDIPYLTISGIDIGLAGILRRIQLEKPVQTMLGLFHLELPKHLLSWGDILTLELARGNIKMKHIEERLANIREEDLADYLEMTNITNAEIFLNSLSIRHAAEVVRNLPVNYQVELFHGFEATRAADIIMNIDPDDAVDILLALERMKRDKIMKALPAEKRRAIHTLMTFSRTPVGKLMTNEFCAVESHMTVREILKTIRHDTTDFASLTAIYVLNREEQLVGVFNPHELMMQDFATPAYKFMVPEPVVVLLTTPIEVVGHKLLKYRLSALPVINREKKIIGIITMDDIAGHLQKKLV